MTNNLVGVAEVIKAIKEELRAAQQVVIGDPKFELTDVVLEMNTVITKETTGEMKVQIILLPQQTSTTGPIRNEQIQKITLSLRPPKPVITQSALDLKQLDLANIIVTIRRELQKGLSQEPKLLPYKLDIEVTFAVQTDIDSQQGFKLVSIQFGNFSQGNMHALNESVHSVKLHFTAPTSRLP